MSDSNHQNANVEMAYCWEEDKLVQFFGGQVGSISWTKKCIFIELQIPSV